MENTVFDLYAEKGMVIAMQCPKCERENEPGARFCAFCGMIMESPLMPAKAQFPTAPPAVSEKAAAEKTEMEITKPNGIINAGKQDSGYSARGAEANGWFLAAVLSAFFSLVLQMIYIIERPSAALFIPNLVLAGLLLLFVGALFLAFKFGLAIAIVPLSLVSVYQLLVVNGISAVLFGEVSASLTDMLRAAFINPLIDFQQLIVLLCCVLTSVTLAGKRGCVTGAVIVTTAALTVNLCPALLDLNMFVSGMLSGTVSDGFWSGWMLNGACALVYASVLLMLLSVKRRIADGRDQ